MYTIETDGYPEEERIILDEITCKYVQEPDCTESREDDYQELILSSRDGGGGKFINIKANNWSIDPDLKGLTFVLEDFKHRMNDTFGSKPEDSITTV